MTGKESVSPLQGATEAVVTSGALTTRPASDTKQLILNEVLNTNANAASDAGHISISNEPTTDFWFLNLTWNHPNKIDPFVNNLSELVAEEFTFEVYELDVKFLEVCMKHKTVFICVCSLHNNKTYESTRQTRIMNCPVSIFFTLGSGQWTYWLWFLFQFWFSHPRLTFLLRLRS